jgi:hypothetical protein
VQADAGDAVVGMHHPVYGNQLQSTQGVQIQRLGGCDWDGIQKTAGTLSASATRR